MFEEMMERAKMEAEAYYINHYESLLNTLKNRIELLSSKVHYLSHINILS